MTTRRTTLHALSVLAATVIGVAVTAPAASAHSELVDSTPKADSTLASAPTQVELEFSEPVTAEGGSIVVTRNGTTVSDPNTLTVNSTTASVQLDAAGESGTYRVTYRIVSSDGHPGEGTFAFTVAGSSGSVLTTSPLPTEPPSSGDDGSTGTVVWVLGLGAIGLVLVAALIAVAMRGRRGRPS